MLYIFWAIFVDGWYIVVRWGFYGFGFLRRYVRGIKGLDDRYLRNRMKYRISVRFFLNFLLLKHSNIISKNQPSKIYKNNCMSIAFFPIFYHLVSYANPHITDTIIRNVIKVDLWRMSLTSRRISSDCLPWMLDKLTRLPGLHWCLA